MLGGPKGPQGAQAEDCAPSAGWTRGPQAPLGDGPELLLASVLSCMQSPSPYALGLACFLSSGSYFFPGSCPLVPQAGAGSPVLSSPSSHHLLACLLFNGGPH